MKFKHGDIICSELSIGFNGAFYPYFYVGMLNGAHYIVSRSAYTVYKDRHEELRASLISLSEYNFSTYDFKIWSDPMSLFENVEIDIEKQIQQAIQNEDYEKAQELTNGKNTYFKTQSTKNP